MEDEFANSATGVAGFESNVHFILTHPPTSIPTIINTDISFLCARTH